MVSLVTLDIAGTTVDEGGAVYTVLKSIVEEHLDLSIAEDELRPALGANKREAIAGFLKRFTGEADPELVEQLFLQFRANLSEHYREVPPQALPGVEDAIDELRAAGITVALTTGFDREITDLILDSLGWTVGDDEEAMVDIVITSDDVAAGRPAPDMIQAAMQAAGVTDPAKVLAAGDTALDLAAGTAAHAGYVVAVTTGAQSAEQLAQLPHTHVCDVQDLPELLGVSALQPAQ